MISTKGFQYVKQYLIDSCRYCNKMCYSIGLLIYKLNNIQEYLIM